MRITNNLGGFNMEIENNQENVVDFNQVEGQGNPPDMEVELTCTKNEPILIASGGVSDPQEDMRRSISLLGIKKRLSDISTFRENIKEAEGKVLDDEDDMAHLDELVRQYTKEQIQHFSEEELDAIYTCTKTGKKIELHNLAPEKAYEFKKDFLLHKKESQTILDMIDIEQAKFEKEYAENEAEINDLLEKFEDMNLALKDKMIEVYEKTEDPLIKEKYRIALEAFDNAFTLQSVYDTYSGLRKSNQMFDYKSRGQQIYKKFLDKIKPLGLRTDLSRFQMLEIQFLDKKFHYSTDFFLFLVFKHVLHRKGPATREWDATFLTQLTINLKRLYEGKMKPEDKETFLGNITKVMDLFDGYYTIDKSNKEDTNMCENEVVPVVEEVVAPVVEETTEVAVEEVAAPVVEEAVEEVVAPEVEAPAAE